jgi:DsbC/DsbD-like thiol-disulfide interchange protein
MPGLLLLLALVSGAAQRPTDVVKWTVAAPASWTTAGGTLKLSVRASVADGWKLYALEQPEAGPTPLAFAAAKPFAVQGKAIAGPVAKVLEDPQFGVNTRYYEKTATFTVPVVVPADLAGMHEIPLEVTFQACGADICLRPYTQKLPVRIEVRR